MFENEYATRKLRINKLHYLVLIQKRYQEAQENTAKIEQAILARAFSGRI